MGIATMVNDLMLESESAKTNVEVNKQANEMKKNINMIMKQKTKQY